MVCALAVMETILPHTGFGFTCERNSIEVLWFQPWIRSQIFSLSAIPNLDSDAVKSKIVTPLELKMWRTTLTRTVHWSERKLFLPLLVLPRPTLWKYFLSLSHLGGRLEGGHHVLDVVVVVLGFPMIRPNYIFGCFSIVCCDASILPSGPKSN